MVVLFIGRFHYFAVAAEFVACVSGPLDPPWGPDGPVCIVLSGSAPENGWRWVDMSKTTDHGSCFHVTLIGHIHFIYLELFQ